MKALHLTDEEIQDYVLDKSGVSMTVTKHAGTCEECKAKVANYQLLFTAIKHQPQPSFDFDLAELVIAKLPAVKPVATNSNSFIYMFALAAIALTGAALYYFRVFIASLFTSITPLLIYLTATSIITLAVMLSMDMYKNYHRKMKALDFY
jgi:CHASE2 domain-containing sensor protein